MKNAATTPRKESETSGIPSLRSGQAAATTPRKESETSGKNSGRILAAAATTPRKESETSPAARGKPAENAKRCYLDGTNLRLR